MPGAAVTTDATTEVVASIQSGAAPAAQLVIGTAQLGMPYGVANRTGRPNQDEADEMVRRAWQVGVRIFDTAQHYGDSEAVLGRALATVGASGEARVVTKLDPALRMDNEQVLVRAMEESLQRLGQKPVWGCLIHDSSWLAQWRKEFDDRLCRLMELGLVSNLGVSIYDKSEFALTLKIPTIRFVQLPLNAWSMDDQWQRLLDEAKCNGKKVFLRSIFLQGLLLMEPETLAGWFPAAARALAQWQIIANELKASPKELAFRFVSSLGFPLVVGQETLSQLRENIVLAQAPPLEPSIRSHIMMRMKPFIEDDVVDPRQWPSR